MSWWDNINLDDLAQQLGKAAQGAGAGRNAQADYENARDRIAAGLYQIAQNARMQAATQNLALDKYRNSLAAQGASEAVRGAGIQNVQPVSIDLSAAHGRIPQFNISGGLGPQNFTPETRAAGAALAAHGTSLLNNPSAALTQTPGSGVGGTNFLTTPTQSPELTPSFWEKAAGVGGVSAGLLSSLLKALQKGKGGGSSGSSGSSGGSEMDTNPLVYYDPTYGQVGLPQGGTGIDSSGSDGFAVDPYSGSRVLGPGGEQIGIPGYPEDPRTSQEDWWNQINPSDESGG